MTKAKGISIGSLNAVSASEQPFEFEVVGPDGKLLGVFLSVLGGQSPIVTAHTNRLINERRKAQALRESKVTTMNPGAGVAPVEDDVAFGQTLAAVRIVGWRNPTNTAGLDAEQLERFQGIEDEFSPALALQLCRINADISAQVLAHSNNMANFTKASPTG